MKNISLFSLLLLISVPIYSLTLDDMITQVREDIQDSNSDTTRQAWSRQQLIDKINIIQEDVVKKSRCLLNTTYYTLYTNTETYTMPSDYLEVDRISIWRSSSSSTSYYSKLERKTLLGLDEDDTWDNKSAGRPEEYYTYGNTFGLIPPANSTYAGVGKLKIQYVVRPSTLSATTDIPFNGKSHLYPYHEIIILGVDMLCKKRVKAWGEVESYRQQYLYGISLMIQEIDRKQDFYPDFQMKFK